MLSQKLTLNLEGGSQFRSFEIITGRNEVVAKVIFLHLSVILFTGGCLPQCMLGCHPPQSRPSLGADPPRADTPLEQTTPKSRHPPEQTPLWSRYPPSRHPQTKYTPGTKYTPPGLSTLPRTKYTPPGKQTSVYGQRAAGTHPTGMHSCLQYRSGDFLSSHPCGFLSPRLIRDEKIKPNYGHPAFKFK